MDVRVGEHTNPMNYRYDLLQWRRERTRDTYDSIAAKASLSKSTVWEVVRGDDDIDPNASTITKTFIALGLDPKYALDFSLKKTQFRRAVVETAR